MRTLLFVSVSRTFVEAEALLSGEGGSGGVELGECWQLTDDQHAEVGLQQAEATLQIHCLNELGCSYISFQWAMLAFHV